MWHRRESPKSIDPLMTSPGFAELWPRWSCCPLSYIFSTNYNYCKCMSSRAHYTDTARQLQDERIKTDRNFFLTWDQWVPPKLGPTRYIQQEILPVGFKYSTRPKRSLPTRKYHNRAKPPASSTMPVNKAHADAMAKKHFGKECKSCLLLTDTYEYLAPTVFDMCWKTDAEAVPLVETSTDASLTEPQYSGQSKFLTLSIVQVMSSTDALLF